jgi:branched-subunit amino acid transport protein
MMRIWGIMLAAGLITFAIRMSFIFIFERLTIPEWFIRSLQYVPAAVLSAILVPELVQWNGKFDPTWNNPQIVAGLLAILVAWRTRSIIYTLLSGLVCFFLLTVFVH